MWHSAPCEPVFFLTQQASVSVAEGSCLLCSFSINSLTRSNTLNRQWVLWCTKLPRVIFFDQHHNDNQVGSQCHVLVMNEPQTQSSKDNLLSETGIILQPVALTNTWADVFINSCNTIIIFTRVKMILVELWLINYAQLLSSGLLADKKTNAKPEFSVYSWFKAEPE